MRENISVIWIFSRFRYFKAFFLIFWHHIKDVLTKFESSILSRRDGSICMIRKSKQFSSKREPLRFGVHFQGATATTTTVTAEEFFEQARQQSHRAQEKLHVSGTPSLRYIPASADGSEGIYTKIMQKSNSQILQIF